MKLTDQEVIRKAVEQADGWKHDNGRVTVPDIGRFWIHEHPQVITDALAAQLERQVSETHDLYIGPSTIEIHRQGEPVAWLYMLTYCGDRTMNKLRCITEWGGLE